MADPRRLIDDSDRLTRRLLYSGIEESPDKGALKRTTAKLGVGIGVATAVGLGAGTLSRAANSALVHAGPLAFVKWLAIGMIVGGLSSAALAIRGAHEQTGQSSITASPAVPTRPANSEKHPVASDPKPAALETTDLSVNVRDAPSTAAMQLPAPDIDVAARAGASRVTIVSVQAPIVPEPTASDRIAAPASDPGPTGSIIAVAPASESPTMPLQLAKELAQVDAARAALEAKNPSGALWALDTYASTRRTGILDPEAAVLRVEALHWLGRHAEAAQLARALIARDPNTSYAAKLRAIAEAAH